MGAHAKPGFFTKRRAAARRFRKKPGFFVGVRSRTDYFFKQPNLGGGLTINKNALADLAESIFEQLNCVLSAV
jgi:hypothetical protein